MNDLAFGLEVLTVGFSVVIVTLILLALILVCFSKFFAPREKKELTKSNHVQGEIAEDDQNYSDGESEQPAVLANNHEDQLETIAVATESSVRPEQVAAIAGAMYAEQTKQARPEVIAAITGAFNYLFEVPGSPGDYKPEKVSEENLWAQTGRTRLLQLRQEFVLLRRGMLR